MRFEEFPRFMEGVQEVKQLDDKHRPFVFKCNQTAVVPNIDRTNFGIPPDQFIYVGMPSVFHALRLPLALNLRLHVFPIPERYSHGLRRSGFG